MYIYIYIYPVVYTPPPCQQLVDYLINLWLHFGYLGYLFDTHVAPRSTQILPGYFLNTVPILFRYYTQYRVCTRVQKYTPRILFRYRLDIFSILHAASILHPLQPWLCWVLVCSSVSEGWNIEFCSHPAFSEGWNANMISPDRSRATDQSPLLNSPTIYPSKARNWYATRESRTMKVNTW